MKNNTLETYNRYFDSIHRNPFKMIPECLLINPPDLNSRYPYLGIATLASMLRQHNISVSILDCSALSMDIDETITYIRNMNPRIIGLTVMSPNLQRVYRLIKRIQQDIPNSVLVVGGAHIDADPASITDLGVRYGFWGECEQEFLVFCQTILSGQTPPSMPGFIHYIDNNLVIGEKRIVNDLNALPAPAYDLLPIERYYSPSTSSRTISFICSRGCPYNCLFCSKLHQKPYRFLGTDNIIKQLNYLVKDLKIEWVEFVDEIFTLQRSRVVELCQAILDDRLIFEWGCGTRADRIDEKLLRLMKKAGCCKIGFGVESGVENIRYRINKRMSNQKIIDAISLCRNLNIKTQTCFIFGHPCETLAEMRQTIRFARNLGSNYPSFGRMIPIPGSELFEIAVNNGEIDPDIWKQFMRGDSGLPIYTPQGVSPEDVNKLFQTAWFSVYFWPKNLWINRDIFLNWQYFQRAGKAFWDFACTRGF